MAEARKITVLLADEDALRRDGLAAVLKAVPEIEVVADCATGQEALETIRDLRPDVAVVDLNIPVLHGIEVVRRVRGEALGSKIIIMAGTQDDEIVREVVRAGADAYLLKNGPARHLTDAINYVRDGGQYFSPQLKRDGRDRHLLEEPPRVPPERAYRDDDSATRSRRTGRFRDRLRSEAPSHDLRDRDYEIMEEMADNISPLLDRLDEIEGRVMDMEQGGDVPADPRAWLSAQLADSMGPSPRAGGRGNIDIEKQLPQMIEEAVTKRFQSMAGKLQEEIEEQHVRTIETFVKNIQTKLVQRVTVLEQNMSQQAEAMHQLQEYNQRTEDNLSRLISGVDQLAKDLPKRLAAAQAEADAGRSHAASVVESDSDSESTPAAKPSRIGRRRTNNLVPKLFWAGIGLAAVLGTGVWYYSRGTDSTDDAVTAAGASGSTTTQAASKASKPVMPSASADTKAKLDAARQYMETKEYATAEDIYRQVVQAEPNNVDALTGLASVLYREDKIDESAAILDRIPKK